MNNQAKRAQATIRSTQHHVSCMLRYAQYFLFIGLLSLAGNAAAVIDVDLSFSNDTDPFGNYSLISGDKLKVMWNVIDDTDGDLHQNDKIELLRVSDDEVLQSIKRGKKGKTNGTVTLKIKGSGELLYVQYKRKGNAGTIVTRYAHPDDDGVTLQSIPSLEDDEVSTELHHLTTGAVAVQARGFQNEGQSANQVTECVWNTTGNSFGYFLSIAGATLASCDVTGGIHLPHGRTVTELHCTFFDNTALTSLGGQLLRADLSTGGSSTILSTPSTVDSTSVQTVSDTTVNGSGLIDNKRYAYSLEINFGLSDFTAIGNLAGVYGCSVYYE